MGQIVRKAKRDFLPGGPQVTREQTDGVDVEQSRSPLHRIGPVAFTSFGILGALLMIFAGLLALNHSVLPFDGWPLGAERLGTGSQILPRAPVESGRLRTAAGGKHAELLDGRVVLPGPLPASAGTLGGVRLRLGVGPQRSGSNSAVPSAPVPAQQPASEQPAPAQVAPQQPAVAAPAPAAQPQVFERRPSPGASKKAAAATRPAASTPATAAPPTASPAVRPGKSARLHGPPAKRHGPPSGGPGQPAKRHGPPAHPGPPDAVPPPAPPAAPELPAGNGPGQGHAYGHDHVPGSDNGRHGS